MTTATLRLFLNGAQNYTISSALKKTTTLLCFFLLSLIVFFFVLVGLREMRAKDQNLLRPQTEIHVCREVFARPLIRLQTDCDWSVSASFFVNKIKKLIRFVELFGVGQLPSGQRNGHGRVNYWEYSLVENIHFYRLSSIAESECYLWAVNVFCVSKTVWCWRVCLFIWYWICLHNEIALLVWPRLMRNARLVKSVTKTIDKNCDQNVFEAILKCILP